MVSELWRICLLQSRCDRRILLNWNMQFSKLQNQNWKIVFLLSHYVAATFGNLDEGLAQAASQSHDLYFNRKHIQ